MYCKSTREFIGMGRYIEREIDEGKRGGEGKKGYNVF